MRETFTVGGNTWYSDIDGNITGTVLDTTYSITQYGEVFGWDTENRIGANFVCDLETVFLADYHYLVTPIYMDVEAFCNLYDLGLNNIYYV